MTKWKWKWKEVRMDRWKVKHRIFSTPFLTKSEIILTVGGSKCWLQKDRRHHLTERKITNNLGASLWWMGGHLVTITDVSQIHFNLLKSFENHPITANPSLWLTTWWPSLKYDGNLGSASNGFPSNNHCHFISNSQSKAPSNSLRIQNHTTLNSALCFGDERERRRGGLHPTLCSCNSLKITPNPGPHLKF